MDKVKQYQEAIINYLNEYAAAYKNDPSGIKTYVIADKENHNYELMRVGWHNDKYLHYILIHFEIKGEKVWILANETEDLVGDELINRGIPKSDIVLGFYPESIRNHTGFAIS